MSLSFTGPYPTTYGMFSASFHQPSIPTVATELKGQFMQHKWDSEVSHVAAGYWYNSAEHGKVRIDEAYDGAFASSVFDYTDTNADGGVKNQLIVVGPSVNSEKSCFDEYVQAPGFPLVTADLLQSYNATFGGVVQDFLLGATQTWSFLYGGTIPVTAYLDDKDVLMGYDFWGADKRTKVVTRFFAHQVGPIAAAVFANFTCSGTPAK